MAATCFPCIQLVEPLRGIRGAPAPCAKKPVACVNWGSPAACPHELVDKEFAEGGHGRAALGVELDAEERVAAGLNCRNKSPASAIGRGGEGLKESGQAPVRREGRGADAVLIIEKDCAGHRHMAAEFGGESAVEAAAGGCAQPSDFGHVGIVGIELWQWQAQPPYSDH